MDKVTKRECTFIAAGPVEMRNGHLLISVQARERATHPWCEQRTITVSPLHDRLDQLGSIRKIV